MPYSISTVYLNILHESIEETNSKPNRNKTKICTYEWHFNVWKTAYLEPHSVSSVINIFVEKLYSITPQILVHNKLTDKREREWFIKQSTACIRIHGTICQHCVTCPHTTI